MAGEKKKGLFIVIDGIDGSGKSSIINFLAEFLADQGHNYEIWSTFEPTDGIYGRQIREMLVADKDSASNARLLLDLYIKDREEHLTKGILPFLDKDFGGYPIVICDRYYYATMAYQGMQGIPLAEIAEKNKLFRKPDIAFFIDVPAEVALQRIMDSRGSQQKFEHLEFLQGLRDRFLELKEKLPDNIRIIDGAQAFEKVSAQVGKEINALLRHGHACHA
ncbi:dTMP kinase [Candidatus Woesearchaeota archaeon]|nr:dTMP kinase [Candidatus Woesearchaeota archaeon]